MRKFTLNIFILILPIIFVGCYDPKNGNLVHLQVVDRNGYTKTISDRDDIKKYEERNIKSTSPHQKIVRIFDKNKKGVITAYHSNGVIWQYLETKAGRAHGVYEEYYSSGKIRVRSFIMEGVADLTDEAKTSWVFDGSSLAYDSDGNLAAEFPYVKGKQHGEGRSYYANGSIAEKIPFEDDQINGQRKGYDKKGNLISLINYSNGKKDGECFYKGSEDMGAYEEIYREGRIVFGKYFDLKGNLYSEISSGSGKKPIFEDGSLLRIEEYKNGVVEGSVILFRKNGTYELLYCIREGQKDGEEVIYYPYSEGCEPMKKISLMWKEGVIHGRVCTWYPNGILESEKDMSNHKKEGSSFCWYLDGTLMMVEEYEKDNLLNGKYMRKGDNVPISRVIDGMGDAYIYDQNGMLVKKVSYYNGKPIE